MDLSNIVRSIRIVIADSLQARLAAEAIRAFDIAVVQEDLDGPADIVLSDIGTGRHGKRRLGALLMELKSGKAGLANEILPFGPYTLDVAYAVLTRDDGLEITLTEKERDILARLYRENGAALDRKTLLDDVWGYADTVETHTLETHIYRLRRKIESDPATPKWLVTEEPGYKLSRELTVNS